MGGGVVHLHGERIQSEVYVVEVASRVEVVLVSKTRHKGVILHTGCPARAF